MHDIISYALSRKIIFSHLQNPCFQGCTVPHRIINQHISAGDTKKPFDRSARKMVFKYSSLQQFPSFPHPHKDLWSQLWPAGSTCCMCRRPRKPGTNSKEPDRELDLLVRRQGCKKSWLTPQSCRITPLTASEHDAPLQKPARQKVSVSARMSVTVLGLKGISFSLRGTRFHEYVSNCSCLQ